MKNFFLLLYASLILTIFSGCTHEKNIQESKTLDFIFQQVNVLNETTLIVFDVDETLITPTNPLLHVKGFWQSLWLYYLYAKTTHDFFFSHVVDRYNSALYASEYKLVDHKTRNLIAALQKRNVKVIGLTSCPTGKRGAITNVPTKKIEDWRIKQLQDFDIDFSQSFKRSPMLFPELSTTHPPLFKSGILFANTHTDKGDLLREFLYRIDWKPKLVIFVDDEYKNVRSVVNAMKQEAIEAVGIHYTAVDHSLYDLDSKAAAKEIRGLAG